MNARYVRLTLFASLMLCHSGCSSLKPRPPVQAGPQRPAPAIIRPAAIRLEYILYLPRDYSDLEKQWPLLLFLHGAGERGHDLTRLERHGPPMLIATEAREFPFVILAPQCPPRRRWTERPVLEALDALLDDIVSRQRIDESRIYVTGLSMGGTGTWHLACRYPDRFAAIAPICGTGNTRQAATIAQVPAWVFYGGRDNRLLIARIRAMGNALKRAGGNVRFTVYPDSRHDAWTETYNHPGLYEWFLEHRRSGNE